MSLSCAILTREVPPNCCSRSTQSGAPVRIGRLGNKLKSPSAHRKHFHGSQSAVVSSYWRSGGDLDAHPICTRCVPVFPIGIRESCLCRRSCRERAWPLGLGSRTYGGRGTASRTHGAPLSAERKATEYCWASMKKKPPCGYWMAHLGNMEKPSSCRRRGSAPGMDHFPHWPQVQLRCVTQSSKVLAESTIGSVA
jgi:hypothetical protein